MIGSAVFYVRMALYFIGGLTAGVGWASFDPDMGTITLQLDALAQVLGGALVFAGTYVFSRVAKRLGWKT